MDSFLTGASRAGNVSLLYEAIQRYPFVLDQIEGIPFVDTPLHHSASEGQTAFALEVARLKPSFIRKLNQGGLSPLELAQRNGHKDLVLRLVEIDPELVRIKGREGITPVHLAAEEGNPRFLQQMLSHCPSAAKVVTDQRETVFHVAVKNKRVQAFEFLFGWVHRANMEDVLTWQDGDGNTVLHIAVKENLPKVLKLLINNVNVKVKNLKDETALDIYKKGPPNSEVEKILGRASLVSTYLNSLLRRRDKILQLHNQDARANDIRTILFVVAVLIATATYQAMLSPPGGFWQDDYPAPHGITNVTDIDGKRYHQAGKVVMSSWEGAYFALLNTTAYCGSVCTIIVLMLGTPFVFFLEIAILFISCSYFVSLLTVFESFDGTTLLLLLGNGVLLISVHLVAFEVHRRQRNRRRVGKYLWQYEECTSSNFTTITT